MTLADLGYLSRRPPLLDPAVRLDPLAGAALDGGRVVFELASGQRVPAAFSSPADGVLQLRLGEAGGVAASQEAEDGIVVEAGGVRAVVGADGSLEIGAFRRAGGSSSMRSAAGPGRLTFDDGRVGWLESAALTADEQLYGGGESFQGPGLRGRTRRVANCETHGAGGLDVSYLNVPFFWSDRGWGVLFGTGAPLFADLGATQADVATFAVDGDVVDLFYFGGDPASLLRSYHRLTGLPGRLPPWAFGVWMSRCSYLSERELHDVLDELADADCPVDVLHVDAWVSGNVIEELTCNWTIDRDRFPAGWVDRLHERGVRVSLWHNPYVLVGSERDRELEAAGLLVRDAGGGLAVTPDKTDRHIVDFTNPAAVAWWQERVRETLAAERNDAFKPDFAEEIPESARFHDGRSGRELRNEYAVLYQAATHGALADADGQAALFCRSGTSGAQRYPCHWVGDTPSTWAGIADALRASLSLSLSGFAFVGHDVGGFWVDGSLDRMFKAFAELDESFMAADADPELFARWAQFGALSPMCRFHGTSRREPSAYPEPARSAAIEACRLRKRLEPYLVAAAREASTAGTPLMRPMPLAYPEAREARDALQYLLGPDVLVAPILEPGGRRRVWAPPGPWEPLLGAPPLAGPGFVEVECSLDAFPVWIRSGTVLDG
jgi:alpha-D-xyloside xylohydrolase